MNNGVVVTRRYHPKLKEIAAGVRSQDEPVAIVDTILAAIDVIQRREKLHCWYSVPANDRLVRVYPEVKFDVFPDGTIHPTRTVYGYYEYTIRDARYDVFRHGVEGASVLVYLPAKHIVAQLQNWKDEGVSEWLAHLESAGETFKTILPDDGVYYCTLTERADGGMDEDWYRRGEGAW